MGAAWYIRSSFLKCSEEEVLIRDSYQLKARSLELIGRSTEPDSVLTAILVLRVITDDLQPVLPKQGPILHRRKGRMKKRISVQLSNGLSPLRPGGENKNGALREMRSKDRKHPLL